MSLRTSVVFFPDETRADYVSDFDGTRYTFYFSVHSGNKISEHVEDKNHQLLGTPELMKYWTGLSL